MKLLILSFYYPPDLCAGSFRCGALVDALQRRMPADMTVEVITTQPNRYREAAVRAPAVEDFDRVRVHRIELPGHDSGMADQSRAFAAYARAASAIAQATARCDAVYATTSRLLTGALGARLARRMAAPLYLDVRDLFAETMADVFKSRLSRQVLPALAWLERRTFRQAARINLVSSGFAAHVRCVAPEAELRFFTNGIDQEFLDTRLPGPRRDGPPLILYAGNVGEGQGLHRVVPDAARRLGERARFRIVGHGGRLEQLREATRGLGNVELCPPVTRAALMAHYAQADILFIHLNDYPAFLKVLPSKLFEYAALERPILAGVAGESAEFLKREVVGAEVFTPCDVDGLIASFDRLEQAGPIARGAFRDKFARPAIMDRLADDLIGFVHDAAAS